jgi:hypothetical protein
MMNFNQQSLPHSQASAKFRADLNELGANCRSFAACVRIEYPAIEQAISYGVPIESIARKLSENYGVEGSMSAFKSALSRIRRVNDGAVSQRLLDETAPLSVGQGGAFGNVVPELNLGMPAVGTNPRAYPFMDRVRAVGINPGVYQGMNGMPSAPIHPSIMPSSMPTGVPGWAQVLPGQAQYSGTSLPMSGLGGLDHRF